MASGNVVNTCNNIYGGVWILGLSRYSYSVLFDVTLFVVNLIFFTVVRSWRQVDVIRKQLNQVQQSLNVANAVDSQEKDPVCVTKECVRSGVIIKNIKLAF